MKGTIEKYEKQHIQVQDKDGKVENQEVAILTLLCEMPEVIPVGSIVTLSVDKPKTPK